MGKKRPKMATSCPEGLLEDYEGVGEVNGRKKKLNFNKKKRICVYIETDGSKPAEDFLESLDDQALNRYEASFQRYCEGAHVRGDRHKPLDVDGGGLWEFKDNPSQTRLFHTAGPGNRIVLLRGMKGKKENRLPKWAVSQAMTARDQYKGRVGALDSNPPRASKSGRKYNKKGRRRGR